jgi:hypothetical protein
MNHKTAWSFSAMFFFIAIFNAISGNMPVAILSSIISGMNGFFATFNGQTLNPIETH